MADSHIATTPSSHKARSSSVASSVVLEMADTTWRMFIPTIGLLMVGRQLDTRYNTKPVLMLVGVAVGSLVAAKLIQHQIKQGGAEK